MHPEIPHVPWSDPTWRFQVPEDEESIPPVLEYNNHMAHKHQDR